MSTSRECAIIRDNISRLNRERPIAYREYIDLHNRVQQIPGELQQLYVDLRILEAADRAAGSATGLALRHPAAWAIAQSLRAATIGAAIVALRDNIRDKEQELQRGRQALPVKRDAWQSIDEQLASSRDALLANNCDE